MDLQEPTVTFVSELQLIVDFMDDNNLLDDDEDFEKELTTISLEVSLFLSLFWTHKLAWPKLITTSVTKMEGRNC